MSFPLINLKAIGGSPTQAGDWSATITADSAGQDFESALLSSKSGWIASKPTWLRTLIPDSAGSAISDAVSRSPGRGLDPGSQPKSAVRMPGDPVVRDDDALSLSADLSPQVASLHHRIDHDRVEMVVGNTTDDGGPFFDDTDKSALISRGSGTTAENSSSVNYTPEVSGRAASGATGTNEESPSGSQSSSLRNNSTAQSLEINQEIRPEGPTTEDLRLGQSKNDKASTRVGRDSSLSPHVQKEISVHQKSSEVVNAKDNSGINGSGRIEDSDFQAGVEPKFLRQSSGNRVKQNIGSQISTHSGISRNWANDDTPAHTGIVRSSELNSDDNSETWKLPEVGIRPTGAGGQVPGNAGEVAGADSRWAIPGSQMRNMLPQGAETGSDIGSRITMENKPEDGTKGGQELSGELQTYRQIPRNLQNAERENSDSFVKVTTNGEGSKNANPGLVGSGRHLLPHQMNEQNMPDSGITGQSVQKNFPTGKLVQTPENEVAGKMEFQSTSPKTGEIPTSERMGTNSAHESEMVDRSAKYATGQTQTGSLKVGPDRIGTTQEISGSDVAVGMNNQSASNGSEFSAGHENRGGNELPMEGYNSDGDEGQLEAVATKRAESVRETSQGKGQDLTRVEQLSEMLMKEVVRLRPLANGEMKMKVQLAEGELEMTLVQKGQWVEARLGRESQESLQLTSQIGQMNESLSRHLIRVTPSETSGSNFIPTQSDNRQGADDMAHDHHKQARNNSDHPRQDQSFSSHSEDQSQTTGHSDHRESVAERSGFPPRNEPQHTGQIDMVA